MKGLIYIDKNRIEYAKVSRKGEKIQVLEGGVIHPDQTLENWRKDVCQKLKERLNPGSILPGNVIVAFGREETETSILRLPKAPARILRQMAAREMECSREGKGSLTADVSILEECREENSTGRIFKAWAVETETLLSWLRCLKESGLKGICALAAEDCLGVLTEEKEEVILAGILPESIRLYRIGGGHCREERTVSFRSEILYREGMEELVFQEAAEQIGLFLKGGSGRVKLLPWYIDNPENAADRISKIWGRTCDMVQIPPGGWQEQGCSLFLGAAFLAWRQRRQIKPVNLIEGLEQEGKRKGWVGAVLTLAAAVLALTAWYSGKVRQETRLLEEQVSLLQEENTLKNEAELEKMQWEYELSRKRGPSEADFQGVEEARLPGMEWESFSYDSEEQRLTLRFYLADRKQGEEYMKRLCGKFPRERIGYGGWEQVEHQGTESCLLTVWLEMEEDKNDGA